MGNSCWRLKYNPLIYSNSFLIVILLDGNITSKKQETVWGNLCAVIQIYTACSHLQVIDKPVVVKVCLLHINRFRMNSNQAIGFCVNFQPEFILDSGSLGFLLLTNPAPRRCSANCPFMLCSICSVFEDRKYSQQ